MVEDAAARWSLATGCLITAEPAVGETRIDLAASLPYGPGGREVPGWTSNDLTQVFIHVRAGREQRASSLLHEMGHALGGLHTESDGVLSGQPGRRDVIDQAALVTVCSRLPCLWQRPESPG